MARALLSSLPVRPVRAGGIALLSMAVALTTACHHSRGDVAAGPSDAEEVEIGYGDSDKREITTPVSSLTEDEIERAHVNHVEQLLQGRVSGLQVTRLANGEFSVRIRGTRSFAGDAEPLIVVDGIPAMSLERGLARVSPTDVKRIDVLKGAAATMYGSRGANGVILITTKRGK